MRPRGWAILRRKVDKKGWGWGRGRGGAEGEGVRAPRNTSGCLSFLVKSFFFIRGMEDSCQNNVIGG